MSSGEPFEIRSKDDLAKLQRTLKEMANKELSKRMRQAITRATKPAKARVKTNAARLPSGGGLAARVAGARLSTQNRISGRNIGIRVSAKSKEGYDLGKIDGGEVRHKAWGREGEWHTQDVPADFFTDAMKATGEDARKEIINEANKIAHEIENAH